LFVRIAAKIYPIMPIKEQSKIKGSSGMKDRVRPNCAIFVFIFILICCMPALARDVSLAWDPVTDASLAGYKVYYGTASRTYGTPLLAGTSPTYTVSGSYLPPGHTYYFAVTAYDTSGNESGYSNEVSLAISTCDINNDGAANIIDLQALVNVILGKTASSPAFDLNGDASVNVLDLQILIGVVLGTRSCP